MTNNFMQVGPGGICFVHGPYTERHCPEFFTSGSPCVTNSQNPEYIAMAQEQIRQTNKIYTQAELDIAILDARREQREVDAKVCDTLEGRGDKPTDRIIGYRECAEAIRGEVK